MFLVKYSSTGVVLWVRSAGGSGSDLGNSVATDASGNIYVTGYFTSPTIVFGSTTLTNSGGKDVFIVKYSPTGNVLWAISFGGVGDDEGNSITTDASNNVCLTGYFYSPTIILGADTLTNTSTSGAYCDLFVVKYSSSGTPIWAKSAGGTSYDIANSIATDHSTNDVYITGKYTSIHPVFGTDTLSNYGGYDMFIAKYSSLGAFVWVNRAGNSYYDEGTDVAIDNSGPSSGSVYVTGSFVSNTIIFGTDTLINVDGYLPPMASHHNDVFVVKYSLNGTVIFAKKYGGASIDKGYSIATDAAGFYLSGQFDYDNIIFDTDTLFQPAVSFHPLFLVKFDFNGNVICASEVASGLDEQSDVMTSDIFGNAYVYSEFGWITPFMIGGTSLIQTLGTEELFAAKYNCSSSTVYTTEIFIQSSLQLFPNPATSSLTIQTEKLKLKELLIYNVLGELVQQSSVSNHPSSVTLDISGLKTGMYFIETTTETGIVRSKFIKQ